MAARSEIRQGVQRLVQREQWLEQLGWRAHVLVLGCAVHFGADR